MWSLKSTSIQKEIPKTALFFPPSSVCLKQLTLTPGNPYVAKSEYKQNTRRKSILLQAWRSAAAYLHSLEYNASEHMAASELRLFSKFRFFLLSWIKVNTAVHQLRLVWLINGFAQMLALHQTPQERVPKCENLTNEIIHKFLFVCETTISSRARTKIETDLVRQFLPEHLLALRCQK